jgi:hypothetical protein
MFMPADNIAPDVATRAPQRSTKRHIGPIQTVSNNTSALTLVDLARARAAKALANSICEEIAHE